MGKDIQKLREELKSKKARANRALSSVKQTEDKLVGAEKKLYNDVAYSIGASVLKPQFSEEFPELLPLLIKKSKHVAKLIFWESDAIPSNIDIFHFDKNESLEKISKSQMNIQLSDSEYSILELILGNPTHPKIYRSQGDSLVYIDNNKQPISDCIVKYLITCEGFRK
jgi:hypothetical protein